jgi:Ran GTPase-activating protein (RanGAP) involved in mRNA processing and transport
MYAHVSAMQSVVRIALANCRVPDHRCLSLCAAVRAFGPSSALHTLDLSSNRIDDTGGEALADLLRGHTSLTWLSLRHNFIRNRSTTALADVLRTNCTLTYLNLDHNHFLDDGTMALVRMLEVQCDRMPMRIGVCRVRSCSFLT